MIFAFPDVVKAPTDIVSVPLDWTPFIPALSEDVTVTSHSVSARRGSVVGVDDGIEGAIQTITISGGDCANFTEVEARIVISDGTDVSRSFRAIVR